jgi:putative aldouronate transport system permease protein
MRNKSNLEASVTNGNNKKYPVKNSSKKLTTEDLQIFSFLIPASVLIIIFCYLPMWGIILAFQDFRAGSPLFSLTGVNWVGLKWFKQFIDSIYFTRIIRNTIRLSLLHLAFGFTTPIIFALIVNELRNQKYKKFVQTASYLPYFISTVVVAGMVISFIEKDGIINRFISFLGIEPREWIMLPNYFPGIYTFTNVWKSFGFGSILYFSTLSSIDPSLYEAARIDGATRWQQVKHITIPSLMFVIAIQLILQIGNILEANTNLILLLYRTSTYSTADVIGTYIYRTGIESGKYSYTSAVGIFMSTIGFFLTLAVNKISNKITGYGLW